MFSIFDIRITICSTGITDLSAFYGSLCIFPGNVFVLVLTVAILQLVSVLCGIVLLTSLTLSNNHNDDNF